MLEQEFMKLLQLEVVQPEVGEPEMPSILTAAAR
jgi:hypothetical protein